MFNYKIGIFISIVIFSIILALSYYFLYKESYNTVQIKSGAYGDLYGKSNPEGDYSFKEDPVRGIRKDYIKREGTNTGALLIKESYYSSPKKKVTILSEQKKESKKEN